MNFTDRYDGHLPSTLTMCSECEGMGWTAGDYVPEVDDYRVIACPACLGTKRCTVWQSVRRIPSWLRRGAAFVWRHGVTTYDPPEWSRWKHVKVALWCAYGADVARAFEHTDDEADA